MLFIAWEVDGEIPDIDAPPPGRGTKTETAMLSQQKLVHQHLRGHMLAQDPDTPPNDLPTFDNTKMDHSLQHHYDAVLQVAVAQRILNLYAISPTEIKQGCGALNWAIQSWACMKAHLTPYFHLATHLQEQFLQFGPLPGFGMYPYE